MCANGTTARLGTPQHTRSIAYLHCNLQKALVWRQPNRSNNPPQQRAAANSLTETHSSNECSRAEYGNIERLQGSATPPPGAQKPAVPWLLEVEPLVSGAHCCCARHCGLSHLIAQPSTTSKCHVSSCEYTSAPDLDYIIIPTHHTSRSETNSHFPKLAPPLRNQNTVLQPS